jgi:DNA repair exonuclease SbcCD ATPase subunit
MTSEELVRLPSLVALPLPAEKVIEIAIVFEQREKIAKLFRTLEGEYRARAVQLACDIAGAEIERFNFPNFVSTWKPLADRAEETRSVLGSFLLTLDQLITSYENEHAEEMLQVLEKKRDELEMTLKEKNVETDEITRRLVGIRQKISELAQRVSASQAASQSTVAPTQSHQQLPTSESEP